MCEQRRELPGNLNIIWHRLNRAWVIVEVAKVGSNGYPKDSNRVFQAFGKLGNREQPLEETYRTLFWAAVYLASQNPDLVVNYSRSDLESVIGENDNNAPFRESNDGQRKKTIIYDNVTYHAVFGQNDTYPRESRGFINGELGEIHREDLTPYSTGVKYQLDPTGKSKVLPKDNVKSSEPIIKPVATQPQILPDKPIEQTPVVAQNTEITVFPDKIESQEGDNTRLLFAILAAILKVQKKGGNKDRKRYGSLLDDYNRSPYNGSMPLVGKSRLPRLPDRKTLYQRTTNK